MRITVPPVVSGVAFLIDFADGVHASSIVAAPFRASYPDAHHAFRDEP
jgi:hypothetical protein